jgi:crotonobetaine/carnitine-CoA ligase
VVAPALLVPEEILHCAAVAAPAHARAGEDEVAVFAVLAEGASMDPDGLRAWCERQLPPFAMPEYVSILPELPKTPSGKVRKVELRELAKDQAAAARA